MTEQELIDEFEEIWLNKTLKNKYDFSVSISQLATWNRKDGAFKCYVKGREKGYSLAQETIKAKDAEIESLKGAYSVVADANTEKLFELEKKDQVIAEAREILNGLMAWFFIKSTRTIPNEFLEKAKTWLESNK